MEIRKLGGSTKFGISEEEGDALYLQLDQTTPQTVENGKPKFSEGIRVSGSIDNTLSAGAKLAFNNYSIDEGFKFTYNNGLTQETILDTDVDTTTWDFQSWNVTANNLSGTNTGDQDLSGLVPYTGAIGNVNLGAFDLSATDVTAKFLEIQAPAISGREVHLKAQTSDAGNDQFGVSSGTSANNNFAPCFFGYKDSSYGGGNYIYSLDFRGLIPDTQDTVPNTTNFGILNFETYKIPIGDASDPNNAASFGQVVNRRLLSFRNGPGYIWSIDANNLWTIGKDGAQPRIHMGGFVDNSSAFEMALGLKYDTSKITGLNFENGNASGQVMFMAESNDGNYTAMNAPGTSVTGSWLGVNRNAAHFLWTNAGRHLAIGTLTSGYDLILGAGDAMAITIDGSNQRVSFNKSTALSNVDIYADDGGLTISGRGDNSANDVVMKVEDAGGTYTGYWGINDGFGNMSIGLNIDKDGNSVGYGSDGSGPAKIVFGGHGADGHVSLNAMKETANGSTIEYDIGLLLDSSDNTLRIGATSDMSSPSAGLLNGAGKKIADSYGTLYSEATGSSLNNIYSDYNGFNAVTSVVSSGLFRNIFTSKTRGTSDGRIALWAATQVDYSTDPTEVATAGLNSFVYHTGTANIGARTDGAMNESGGSYAVRIQSNATVATGSGVMGQNMILSGYTGGLTNSYNFMSRQQQANGGTITNAFGFKHENGSSTTGSIVNQYGVYIDELTEGTNSNYAIYTDGDTESYFGGKITSGSDTLQVSISKTPSSASDTGIAGEIAWDSNYIYVCVATNTWKRTSLSTW